MVIVVVKWSIKPDTIQAFRRFWSQEAQAQDRPGLVAEFSERGRIEGRLPVRHLDSLDDLKDARPARFT